ncbi:MAG TPA: hypothetical protein VFN67_11600 [Polyangiales bacterium]|nr:hypothetical protein [Polyangiales bacterium]
MMLIPKTLSAVTSNPWWPAIKVGLLVLAVASVWMHGRSAGKESEKEVWEKRVAKAQVERIERYEAELTKFRQQAAVDQKSLQVLGVNVLALETEVRRLEKVKIPVVVKKEVPANANGKCLSLRLSDAFGVCVGAVVTGSPADSRACQAFRSDESTRSVSDR